MKDTLPSSETLAAFVRPRWICLFLALFLLYNPFHAALRGNSTLDVCHPASHRATVGASELLPFIPAAGWASLPAVDLAEVEVPAFQPLIREETRIAESPRVVPLQQFFGAGLWFRPPPAR